MRPSSTSLHLLQLRAFLDASDDVEIDGDTLNDLLEGFENEGSEEGTIDDGQNEEDEEQQVVGVEDEDSELDISALYVADPDGKLFRI
jgi:hypothetical protein